MWRRYPDTTGCTVILLRLLLWMFVAKYSHSQDLPSRDTDYAFGINQRSIFYDTNAIPDGVEVNPYLFANTTKKFFFQLENTVAHLHITVTPCASPVIWQVTHKPLHKNPNKEPYDFGNDVENSLVDYHPVINTNDILYRLSGEDAATFSLDAPAEGIYTIAVTSVQSDSYVGVFTATSPALDRPPELPQDSRVNVLDKTKTSFKISWNPSPDERAHGDNIEYCVALNRKRSYKTLCSVLSHLNGDPKPTLPPGNGFGFSTDAQRKRYLRHNAKPIRPAKKGSIFFKCLGKKNVANFEKVKTRKGYYVDVFIRNKQSNERPDSRHYSTLYIKSKRKRKLPKIKDGKTRTLIFTKKKRKLSYSFRIKKPTRDVHFAINSCSGLTHIEVTGDSGVIHESKVRASQALTLKHVKPGNYKVALSKTVSRKTAVYLTFTAKKKKLKLPTLPDDKTVKVFKSFTSCNSVTVALKGTTTKQSYCLYKSEIPVAQGSSSLSSRKRDCGALSRWRNGAQKITCKTFKYRSKDNAILAITVTNLKRNTSYIFDVFVNSGKYFTFPYNSVRTKTNSTCYLPT